MIDMFINYPDFLAFRCHFLAGKNLNGTIGAVHLAYAATGATVLVIIIVRHDHLPFITVKHNQVISVLRIFLGDNFTGTNKIPSGDPHSGPKRFNAEEYIF